MEMMAESGATTDALAPLSSLGRSRRRPTGRRLLRSCLLGCLLASGVEAYQVFLGSNFHMVIPDRVYRSAQLTAGELEQQLRAKGIRTVVNLRGDCDPSPWYVEESRVTNRWNVCQEDICFAAGHLPSVSEVRRLVEVLDRTAYPILLHCRRGADRTGMTAAVVLLLQTDASLRQAQLQLGLRYGHLPLGRTAILDEFLDLYAEWLRGQGLAHTPAVFRRWLGDGYCPAACRCQISAVQVPAAIVHGQPFAVRARFCNTSIRPWHLRAGSTAGIHGSYGLWDSSGNLVCSGRSGLFDADVGPQESINLTLALPALRAPGIYRLQIDMVDEQHCFFHQAGSEPWEQELDVR
jgi:protein tyrosine phosphatase (PTP) superfamily phosphohydrolase (DUF442 family)